MQTGTIVAPADGPVSWTTHDDLAEAIAVVLADESRLDGVTPPLTGQESLDLSDVAALVSELTGRTVRRVVADDDEWKAGHVARGMPAPRADFMLGMFLASRRGEFDVVDRSLPDLLGRPATPLGSFSGAPSSPPECGVTTWPWAESRPSTQTPTVLPVVQP